MCSFDGPAEKRPYHYVQCGLDNIYLGNGFEVDLIDGEEYVRVQNVEELWKTIGIAVSTNPSELTPKEIRFLRNHMELTQEELGKKLGVDGQTVARWEKEQTKLPGPANLAIRTLFLTSPAAQPEGSEIIVGLYEAIERQESESPKEFSAIQLIRVHDSWTTKSTERQLEFSGV